MKDNKILNIIIPAYNAKETLDKMLRSLSIQRTKYKFDVLVVNDKSDYTYEDIIDKYSKYLEIKELILNENVGPGQARQKGIEETNKKYIMFIDADDYLYSPYSIEKLINKIEKTNADVVISNFILERDNKREIKELDNIWLHGKIFKRQFIEDNKVTFNLTRKNEDNGFNRLLWLIGDIVEYLDEVTYVYQENSNSITRKDNRKYKLYGLEGLAENMYWAYEEAKKRKVVEDLLQIHLLTTLTASYYYYNELQKEYDVSLILKWFKKIYIKYKEYEYNQNTIDQYLHLNKDILETIKEPYITYKEYLNKLEEYND